MPCPGSPLVAERTVELLRSDDRVELVIVPAMSFMDLVMGPGSGWTRWLLGTYGRRNGLRRPGGRGARAAPRAQTHSRGILSLVKLAVEEPPRRQEAAVLLHHLGLDDEVVSESCGRSSTGRVEDFDPDHLTSVVDPEARAPVARRDRQARRAGEDSAGAVPVGPVARPTVRSHGICSRSRTRCWTP